ncbi:MAG TPA: DNA polymerase/3'-5' exonuclease PolX [Bacillota bacterium]|nr:DNA polymerase/3'-5' exonuclease PolX [Bacillota bacterium]
MRNIEVAWIFHELADLLELKGEDFFKIRAYRNAARILAGLEESVEEIWKRGELVKTPGIGRNIAAKIDEILTTGRLRKLEDLLREIPSGVLDIMSLPGIGPKRAGIIFKNLGVSSIGELAKAAREGRVKSLPGMGGKTENAILRYIEARENSCGRTLLVTARELAGELAGYLKDVAGATRVEAGGSIRRWQETVGDIDLVVASDDPGKVLDILESHPRIKEVIERDGQSGSFQTGWGIVVDVEVVSGDFFETALFLSTGSKAHLGRLRKLGQGQGLSADFPGSPVRFAYKNETDIYSCLGLPYIPPELREDRGEVEAALGNRLPELFDLRDIKGDLHIHTDWSDGLHSVERMAARAREKGYQYIAITDHSQSLKIARGLSPKRLKKQHEHIRSLNENSDGFYILTGIEVDILPKGGLDCPEEILKETELVIASVHSAFKQDRDTMTARIISAVENRNVDIIGHLTGRLIGQRDEYALDVERVLEAAADCGTILEINSSPDRLDLNDVNARRAKERGIRMAVSTDAHDLKRMDEMPYGVAVARRAWLERENVVNTAGWEELRKILKKK